MESYDFIVVGAGITGLTIAYELRQQNKEASILVLEKESQEGKHASGRNSGVLHSGVYYPKDSLKSQVCRKGGILMEEFCIDQKVPIKKVGKLILPTHEKDDATVDLLFSRGKLNNINIELVDNSQLNELEPDARNSFGRGLFLPDVNVVDPCKVLAKLVEILTAEKVKILFSYPLIKVHSDENCIVTPQNKYRYKRLFNATGQHAEVVAQMFGSGIDYQILPIKGVYYKLVDNSGFNINHLIYPVPDLEMPFLGVHSVRTLSGETYFGPSAIPAFGRENYHGLNGFNLSESSKSGRSFIKMYWNNKQNFRKYTHQESTRFLKSKFMKAVNDLFPGIKAHQLLSCQKVGIRAQLIDKNSSTMVTDFIIERKGDVTHVLNAISPAFTCSFSFAKKIINT